MPRSRASASSACTRAASWRARGSCESSERRIRSTRVRTRSGWVPHAGERNSHSLGPRLPCSASRTSRPAGKSTAGSPRPSRRLWSPSVPASKAAVNSSELATWRLRSHMAKLGAADTTPPSPPAMRRSSPGLPRPRAMAVMAPIVTEAAALTSPGVAKTRAIGGLRNHC